MKKGYIPVTVHLPSLCNALLPIFSTENKGIQSKLTVKILENGVK